MAAVKKLLEQRHGIRLLVVNIRNFSKLEELFKILKNAQIMGDDNFHRRGMCKPDFALLRHAQKFDLKENNEKMGMTNLPPRFSRILNLDQLYIEIHDFHIKSNTWKLWFI